MLNLLDRSTRAYWRTIGRPVDLTGAESWLDAPTHTRGPVGEGWIEAAAASYGGTSTEDPDGGLLPDLSVLDGPGFRAADLDPSVRDFYEHTARWRMEVWSQWNPLLQPGGELVLRLFGRRVQQLAIPTGSLDVAGGMDSRVVRLTDGTGAQRSAAWLRTLRSTGDFVYSGCYTTAQLPRSDRRSVHVTFPLEDGNVQVFLRPTLLAGGGLQLDSPPGSFGQDGAYVTVGGDRTSAARAPIHEQFRVYVDDEGVLRTDHVLRMRSVTALRLHYKLTRDSAAL